MSNKHRDHIERRYNALINALRLVIHYNVSDDFLDNLIVDLHVYGENYSPITGCKGWYCEDNPVEWLLWQMIICMYGDYGTSPRSGWITDLAGALRFLDELKGGNNNVE